METSARSREERARDIRAARAALKLKQADVGALAGIHQATVSTAEDGRASDQVYDLIEAALGLAS
jgi:transcriptional regulator with XRE-family HTH domain